MPTTAAVWVIVALVSAGPGDAEIHHLDPAAGAEHHVGRLDVAVHNARLVAVAQGVEDTLGQFQRARSGRILRPSRSTSRKVGPSTSSITM